MPATLPDIIHVDKKNPTVDSPNSSFEIPFYKDNEYLANLENFVSFIKSVESLVRRHDDYKKYIVYIREVVGLDRCQVLGNIHSADEKEHTKLEMHHGPILTLFDLAVIITDWALVNRQKVTTFKIAEILLNEHFNNNVQVTMLSTTIHEQVHEGNVWLNMKQAFGDIHTFITKYKDGLDRTHIEKINRYIEKSIERDSYHNGVLELNEFVKSWNSENMGE